MFLPFFKSCMSPESNTPEAWRERRLKFLKMMRNDLETRLAAINAAIETMERQNSREEA